MSTPHRLNRPSQHRGRYAPCSDKRGGVCASFVLAMGLHLGGAPSVHAQSSTPLCVAIMGTNDVHGALEPYTVYGGTPGLTVKAGGVLAASAYIDNLRRTYGRRSLVLDAGDIFQGTLASNTSLGKAMIDAYNAAGYDAAAIGNHEFDFGALPGQNANSAARRLGVLQARIREAKFPFLAVNIFERQTHKRIDWDNVQPSVLRDLDGIKVGIIGAATPTTPYVTKTQNVATLEFMPPAPLVAEEARALRQAGAQLVVLVAHMGGGCGEPRRINALAASARHNLDACAAEPQKAELMALLQSLPEGCVDVAIGGHTHQFMAHWVNGVATLESGARGKYMGWVEACLAPGGAMATTHRSLDLQTSAIHGPVELCLQTWDDGTCWADKASAAVHPAAFLAQPLVPNPHVKDVIAPYLQTVAAMAHRPIGARLARETSRAQLCSWVAEAMRRITFSDFALQNKGGVRTELVAGDLSFEDIYNVLPFDNYVSQVTLTGQQLTHLVAHMQHYSAGPEGPVFVGLKSVSTPTGLRVLTEKGQPLGLDTLYTLSTTDFMLQGGDGADAIFAHIPKERMQISDIGMRDALVDFLTTHFPAPQMQDSP